jgi:Zn-dependent peptidase ImmA (M78 family)
VRLLELDPIQAEANRNRAAAGIRPPDVVPDMVTVLRALGLVVAVRELAWDGLDGINATAEGGGVVVLNGGKVPVRLRRVAAHLLAHHVYGDDPHVDHDIDDPDEHFGQQRANAFAARFLVSREAVWTRRGRPGTVTPAEATELACDFGVGYRLILERLQEVGMLGPDAAQPPAGWSQLPNSSHPSHSAR